MTQPAFLIGFILSTLYGAVFHLLRGGSIGRMIFYIILSWVGFWIGHYFGNSMNNTIGKLGTLQAVSATAGSFICLIIGYWLSLVSIETK